MRCFQLTGSDDRINCEVGWHPPLNLLPVKCPACKFPNLDHVPRPYFLMKSRARSPNELALAEVGNLLVRERVRRVLEALIPDQVVFHPTLYRGTTEATPWFLAVPARQVEVARIDPKIPRCAACGEPRSAHPGTQYREWLWKGESEHHLLKGSTWGSDENGRDKWVSRDTFMSVRLYDLLQRIKAKGLYEATCSPVTRPNAEERSWTAEALGLLDRRGIPRHPAGGVSEADEKWFRGYLKARPETARSLDVKAWEKRAKIKLPKSYVEFLAHGGPATFKVVEGRAVDILPPEELDSKSYRQGTLDTEDEESCQVNGLMFARAKDGDAYCFDVRKGRREYRVVLYRHDHGHFEDYAENFAACVRRFAESES